MDCYDNIEILKEERSRNEDQDDLEHLAQLGNSAKLKENLHGLISRALNFFLDENYNDENSYLVVQVDGVDLSTGDVYEICEDIHRYLSIPNVIVLMAADYTQLRYEFYLVKITNVLDHTFPEFKPFFQERFSRTAFYLLENYGTAEKMAHMNSASYDNLRRISRGKFSPQKFLELKNLAANTVGVNNSIFDTELNCLLTLYKDVAEQVSVLEKQIKELIEEVHPHYMSIPSVGPISAAIIYAEYGDISNFSSPAQMLAFAGLEPGINESGTESHKGRMVKRGSSQLRYVLMNCALPLIRFDMTFAAYYAKKRAEGKPHRVAMSHVGKKLVRVIFALERQNTDFKPQALR